MVTKMSMMIECKTIVHTSAAAAATGHCVGTSWQCSVQCLQLIGLNDTRLHVDGFTLLQLPESQSSPAAALMIIFKSGIPILLFLCRHIPLYLYRHHFEDWLLEIWFDLTPPWGAIKL